MANYSTLLEQAQRTIASVAGVTVKYSRGSAFAVLTAVPAVSNFNADGDQIITEYRSRDFIVASDSLFISGLPITPKKGDIIEETVGTSVHRYQVSRPDGGNDQPWRYTDTGRSFIRVHTILKDIE
jgi:hypothetical protein